MTEPSLSPESKSLGEQPRHEATHKHSSNDAAVIAARRIRMGVIGVLVTSMVVLSALQMDKLPFLSNGAVYTAQLADASGLRSGDSVVVAGVEVGKVRSIALRDSTDADGGPLTTAEVTFDMADDMVVGTSSKASVQAETILGRRNLTITPAGGTRLRPGGDLPVEQTTPGYTLTEALQDTAATIGDTKLSRVDEALDSMSEAFRNTPDDLRDAVDGITRLSRTIASRDDQLGQLLGRADDVSEVVADRSGDITTLLAQANALFGELQRRNQAIETLLTGIKDVSVQLRAFIDENGTKLAPALRRLDDVVKVMQDNKSELAEGIDRLGPYANSLGEAVASAPYFQALAQFPSSGDITNIFIKLFKQKYPQAWQAMLRYNPINPKNFQFAPKYNIADDPRNAPTATFLPPTSFTPGPP
ncbi:MCE family protein [Gordonia pseudamarae]|jgi:phospholipid/cholesterol/gamma-HCH transport system substrate-binding protein|uniref:MCE family protein n=1 Tax=Gordonia pseudamarae TaxID=2831662 RepID=A0ABX6IDN6_9ACTN|nr:MULTISPECIES: MCE family protein [Gordonia]MBD0022338.1 MCE family protein [Gordonia sp. (in: high G+C Gram-positive bacteria)]QHN25040.1 MCE family protein [Gordonia pseudamarae]QHN33975.1 MCE family protein [Gordonia pseudamarae]